MSDPYGVNGPRHEQETRAQPAIDPYAPQQPGASAYPESSYQSNQQYGQPGYPQQYGQQGYPQYDQYPQQKNAYGQQPYQPYQPYAGYQPAPTNGLALASLITSIAGIFVLCGLSGIVAIVLGVLGLKRSREIQEIGRGQAIAGIVIGAIQVVLLIGFIVAMIAVSAQDPSTSSTTV